MTNPLGGGATFGRHELAVGETREIVGRDKETGSVVKQCTLTRSARPYVYDLADAYNQDIPAGPKRWFVDHGGNLRFDDPPARPRPEIIPKAA